MSDLVILLAIIIIWYTIGYLSTRLLKGTMGDWSKYDQNAMLFFSIIGPIMAILSVKWSIDWSKKFNEPVRWKW